MDYGLARALLREEANRADATNADPSWVSHIRRLSQACEDADIRTHVAFIGTAILARATDPTVDVFSIKSVATEGSYSARTLAAGVLAKEAPALGIHLGVTGREPLNNMPYFRMERLDDGTRIRKASKAPFDIVLELAQLLSGMDSQSAKGALRSFVLVRREYKPKYQPLVGQYSMSPLELAAAIKTFVEAQSDGGRRAQGAVAGLLDAMLGESRVSAGRVNDPSRHYPGDVAIRSLDDAEWEKVVEVRDKYVDASDVLIFCQRCIDAGVRTAAVVAVANGTTALDVVSLEQHAKHLGLGLRLFHDWGQFVGEVAFWSTLPTLAVMSDAPRSIQARLEAIEVPEASVSSWARTVEPFQIKDGGEIVVSMTKVEEPAAGQPTLFK